MRKLRFREEQHCLSDDSFQKGDEAGPGVSGMRRGPRPGGTLQARCGLQPQLGAMAKLQLFTSLLPSKPRCFCSLGPANELSAMEDFPAATLY